MTDNNMGFIRVACQITIWDLSEWLAAALAP